MDEETEKKEGIKRHWPIFCGIQEIKNQRNKRKYLA